jgi:hypothetical protein
MGDDEAVRPEGSWRNRIVGREEVDPNKLLAHPENWRIHPQAQSGALKGILDEVGFVQDVIVNLRTDPVWGEQQHHQVLIDGHLRVALAVQKNEPTVPVVYVDINPDEEKLVLATFDPIGDLAVPDRDKLDGILVDVQVQDLNTRKLLDQLSSDSGVSEIDLDETSDPLPFIDIEGLSLDRLRCIVVFEGDGELADFYQRFGREPDMKKILWRYADLVGMVEAEGVPS